MRVVTPAEASVLRSMLAAQPVSERERISGSGVVPRTFRDVRARLYAEGWLVDRYLPDPVLLGAPCVTFLLAEPYIERMDAVVESWTSDPQIVHLWRSPQGIVAVRLGNKPRPALPGIADISDGKAMRRSYALTVDGRTRPIPIYFDFEAAWSRLFGLNGTLAYPHAWQTGRAGSSGSASGEMSPSARAAFTSLIRRPFEVMEQGRSPILTAPFFLPPSQRRVLDRTWVQRRVFLEPARFAGLLRPKVENLAFVYGKLLPNGSPRELLDDLVSACGVTPFLYASDGSSVLLGSLSPAPPEVLTARTPRASVSGTLGTHLEGIEVFRVPLSSLSTVLNHRYDRLLPGGSARAG